MEIMGCSKHFPLHISLSILKAWVSEMVTLYVCHIGTTPATCLGTSPGTRIGASEAINNLNKGPACRPEILVTPKI
jgi:hypothetical protein